MESTHCIASLVLTPRQLTKQTILDIQVSTFIYDIEFSVTINYTRKLTWGTGKKYTTFL